MTFEHAEIKSTSIGDPEPKNRKASIECVCGWRIQAEGNGALCNVRRKLDEHIAKERIVR